MFIFVQLWLSCFFVVLCHQLHLIIYQLCCLKIFEQFVMLYSFCDWHKLKNITVILNVHFNCCNSYIHIHILLRLFIIVWFISTLPWLCDVEFLSKAMILKLPCSLTSTPVFQEIAVLWYWPSQAGNTFTQYILTNLIKIKLSVPGDAMIVKAEISSKQVYCIHRSHFHVCWIYTWRLFIEYWLHFT